MGTRGRVARPGHISSNFLAVDRINHHPPPIVAASANVIVTSSVGAQMGLMQFFDSELTGLLAGVEMWSTRYGERPDLRKKESS